ncbi:MAG: T9SS type A sorting domain-containing protein [Bacteroidota bacterium]|nr:T9SS type A sorting domain-containing protein [Bacteroidota bacterium]
MKKLINNNQTIGFCNKRFIIYVLILISSQSLVKAQTPSFYNSITTTNPTSYPFNYNNGKVQVLYAPGEFPGSYFGKIYKIYVRSYGNTSTGTTMPNLTIKMLDTTLTTLPGGAVPWITGNFQTCYSSTFTIPPTPTTTWFAITLQTPFLHNPLKSLFIDISHNATSTYGFQVCQISGPGRVMYGLRTSSVSSGMSTTYPILGFDMIPRTYNDAGIISIDSPYSVCLGANNTFKATISNFGANRINGVTINWSVNGALQFPSYYPGLLDTIGGVSPNSIQITLGNAIPLISPTVVKAWTSFPNSAVDTVRSNDSTTANKAGAMSGTYTIGVSGANFASFTSAISTLQVNGVCGHVMFNVMGGTYNEAINMPVIPNAASNRTITFSSISKNPDSVIISCNGTIPLTLIGSYVNFKNLTFSQLSASSNCVVISGGPAFDTIYNCKISAAANSTNTNNTVFVNGYGMANVVLRKNIFTGSSYGINISSYPNWSVNCMIDSNTFQNTYYSPIYYLYNTINLKVQHNIININGTGTTNTMNLQANDSAFEFSGNQITTATGITHNIILGFYNVGNASNRIKIYNNSFTGGNIIFNAYFFNNYVDFYNNVFNSAGNIDWGYLSNNMRFYNNTVNSTGTYPLVIHNGSSSGLEIRNNVLSSTAGNYAAFWFASPTNEICDYNNYYSTGTNIIYNNATSIAYSNLGMWKVASAKDSASLTYRPAFTSLTNLQPSSGDSACWSLNGRGIHSFVSNDINGNIRPATHNIGVPDIGAFEFTPAVAPPMAIATPTSPALGATQSFLFGQDTVAKINWPGSGAIPSSIAVRLYSGTNPPALNGGNYMKSYWDFSAPIGTYNHALSLYYKDPWLGTNPNEISLRLAKYNTSWIPFIGTTSSADTIRNIIYAPGLTNFAIFTGTNNNNPLPVKLIYFSGTKSGNEIILNWATVSEINSKSFEIEKSLTAEIFENIGEVKASTHSAKLVSYFFIDKNADQNISEKYFYYRLKMTDIDGRYTFSNTIKIDTKSEIDELPLIIYPNSFSNELFVKLAPSITGVVNVNLTDLFGKVIYSKSELIDANKLLHITNLNDLKQGVYLLSIKTLTNVYTVKLIKD